MKIIQFPNILQSYVNGCITQNKREYWEEDNYKGSQLQFRFSYVRIDVGGCLHTYLTGILKELGYTSIKGLRINIFEGDHFLGLHEDSAFPGHDTLIIPISLEEPRFRIYPEDRTNFHYLDEKPLQGVVLDEGTLHEVIKGSISKSRRITICGWIKKEKVDGQ